MLERYTPERVAFIVNPKAGREVGRERNLRLVDEVAKGLQSHSWLIEIYYTKCAGDETPLVEEAVEKGSTIVTMVTGDGGLPKGAKGIIDKGNRNVALAALQIGTINNFAHDLRTPKTAEQIVAAMLSGVRRPMDIGEVEVSSGEKHIFLLMADAGFLADAMSRVHPPGQAKNGDGAMQFIREGVRSLISYKGVPAKLTFDNGEAKSMRIVELLFGNSQRLVVATLYPKARVNDGWLEMAAVEGNRGLALIPGGGLTFILRGRNNPLALSTQIKEATAVFATPVALETDGETKQKTDYLKTTVRPEEIIFFVPDNKRIKIFGRS